MQQSCRWLRRPTAPVDPKSAVTHNTRPQGLIRPCHAIAFPVVYIRPRLKEPYEGHELISKSALLS